MMVRLRRSGAECVSLSISDAVSRFQSLGIEGCATQNIKNISELDDIGIYL